MVSATPVANKETIFILRNTSKNTLFFSYKNMLSQSEPREEIEIATNKITTMFLFFYEQGDGPSFSWASPDQRDAEMSIALGEGREFTKSKDVRMRKGIYVVLKYMKNRWASRMVIIFLRWWKKTLSRDACYVRYTSVWPNAEAVGSSPYCVLE